MGVESTSGLSSACLCHMAFTDDIYGAFPRVRHSASFASIAIYWNCDIEYVAFFEPHLILDSSKCVSTLESHVVGAEYSGPTGSRHYWRSLHANSGLTEACLHGGRWEPHLSLQEWMCLHLLGIVPSGCLF